MRVRFHSFFALLICFFVGCSSPRFNEIPSGYYSASIRDFLVPVSTEASDIFYITHINGARVHDVLKAMNETNYEHGFFLGPRPIERTLPTGEITLGVSATRVYPSQKLNLLKPEYHISGTVTFTPLPQHTYIVRGELASDYRGIWVEDVETGAVMGQKIERR